MDKILGMSISFNVIEGEVHFFRYFGISLQIISILLSLVGVFYAIRNDLKKIRWLMGWNLLTSLFIFVCLVIMTLTNRFEYRYVYEHSARHLPLIYKIIGIWAGKEGSFHVWLMAVNLVVFLFREWILGVGAVVYFAFVLCMNIILAYPGMNFLLDLTRDSYPEVLFFKMPGYVEMVVGKGINPLLESPWMTIHPPAAFIAYASATIPYLIALSYAQGFRYNNLYRIMMIACGNTFFWFSMALGLGMIWAYETLSFGGYWAWDPVENAALVPWLLSLALLHASIAKKEQLKNNNLPSFIYWLSVSPLILSLYASYLTRSGVLADTSAHSYAKGLYGLFLGVLTMGIFIMPFIFFFIWKKNKVVTSTYNSVRSQILIIGSNVLLGAACFIIFFTSLPVFNSILGTSLKLPEEPQLFYSKWSIPFAMLVLILSFLPPYVDKFMASLKNNTLLDFIIRNILPVVLLTPILTFIATKYTSLSLNLPIFLVLLFAILSLTMEINLLVDRKNVYRNWGSIFAHVGFSILIVGVVISMCGKIPILPKFPMGKESFLLKKDQPLTLLNGEIEYKKDTSINNYLQYDFILRGRGDSLALRGILKFARNGQPLAIPHIKRFLDGDYFFHIASAPIQNDTYPDSLITEILLSPGDTFPLRFSTLIFDTLEIYKNLTPKVSEAIFSHVTVLDSEKCEKLIAGAIISNEKDTITLPDTSVSKTTVIILTSLNYNDNKNVGFQIKEREKISKDWVVVRLIYFPYIWLVWLGCLIIIIGGALSLINSIKSRRLQITKEHILIISSN